MRISNKQEFKDAVNKLKFRYAKTYTDKAPHEYAMAEDDTEELEVIRVLNRYIDEHYDEIEIFWNKEYKVVFVDNHKYWQVGEWNITKFLNRNWDFKNDNNITDTSITESYKGS